MAKAPDPSRQPRRAPVGASGMRLFAIAAAAVFALDQASKYLVLYGLGLLERGVIEVARPFLVLRMGWNTGVNFGLLSHDAEVVRWGLVALALGISALVTRWVWAERERAAVALAGGILVGGALGNVVDRLVWGAVADFLNVSCCGIENPYVFNVADICIVAGALGLALFAGGRAKSA